MFNAPLPPRMVPAEDRAPRILTLKDAVRARLDTRVPLFPNNADLATGRYELWVALAGLAALAMGKYGEDRIPAARAMLAAVDMLPEGW